MTKRTSKREQLKVAAVVPTAITQGWRSGRPPLPHRIAPRAGALALLTLAAGFLLTGCRPSAQASAKPADDRVVSLIMSDIGFNAEIIHVIKDEVAKQGFTVNWVVVNDIIQPNKMVDAHEADANNFQHEPYLDQFVKDQGLKNVTRAFYTIFTPSGLYSKKYKSLDQVPDGATIAIPVDPANNGRALFLLRDKGLLELKPGVPVTHASLKDITANPHRFKFREVDQLMLQRTIADVDVGFLFAGYALLVGFDPVRDALALERVENSPYKGVVAVHRSVLGTPKIKALQKAYASDAFKAYYRNRYGDAILFLDELNHD